MLHHINNKATGDKEAMRNHPWADTRERAEWIKYQLALNGFTLRAVARDLEVSQTAVAVVVQGRPNRFIEPKIAKLIGVKPQWLFPEHYKNGRRVRQNRPMQRRVRK